MQRDVHFRELFGGFGQPGVAPATRHLAVAPAFHAGGVVPADLDHGPYGVGRTGVRARVGGTPRRMTARVSASPSHSDSAAPGWDLARSRGRLFSTAWAARSLRLRRARPGHGGSASRPLYPRPRPGAPVVGACDPPRQSGDGPHWFCHSPSMAARVSQVVDQVGVPERSEQ